MKASIETPVQAGPNGSAAKKQPARAPIDRSAKVNGVQTGRLIGLDGDGRPLVRLGSDPDQELAGEGQVAKHVCPIGPTDVGREVVLAFEGDDPGRPIVLGILQAPGKPGMPVSLSADGEQLTLTARKEIVLRCGKASITLTRAGKVLVRGGYLLSRSSGVNRIKGGSVQIN